MYLVNKKNKGFVLIEVLVIINLLILITTLSYKQTISSIIKSEYSHCKSDLRTLTVNEEYLLIDVENKINSDIELKNKLINFNDISKINYILISQYDSNLWFEITGGYIYIVKKLYSSKSYKEVKVFIVEENGQKKVEFIPLQYKTEYLN